MQKFLLSFLLYLSAVSVSFAHSETQTYNRISFSASAQTQISNDILVITMRAHEKGRDLETLSDSLNKTMSWALKLTKKADEIQSQTKNYQTSPWYEKGKQKGWQVSQSLMLKSSNIEEISKLMKHLQTKMQVQSSAYQADPEKLSELQDQLTQTALLNFTRKADNITQTLSGNNYQIVTIQIHANADNHPRPMMHMEVARASMKSVEAPSFEAGSQKVTVSISGTIEISR